MARISLPVAGTTTSAVPSGLPRVVRVVREGPVLHPTSLGGGEEVLGLNLTQGCVHRCAFCSVRAAPGYRGDQEVHLYANTAERLEADLATRPRPRAVFLSPATDPFPPLTEVQAELGRVVSVLAGRGVQAWLLTRGFIRPAALQVLAAHRRHVKVTVALTTLDRCWQRTLEPGAAPPSLRLRQIAELRRLGISVQAALDPLVPGVTDTRANLGPVLKALAEAGVRQVTAGYMFLREGIRADMARALGRHGLEEMVLDAYAGGPVLSAEGLAPARYLPRARRQRGYASLMALAAEHGIKVSVSGLSNPDFLPPRPVRDEAIRRRLSLALQTAQQLSQV